MNLDIRLSLGFFHHPKTLKLQKRAGIEAVVGLLRLWLWAAEQRSSGILTDMDGEDIELAAEWPGTEGQFVKTLIDCRWIDEKDGVFSLHGWDEHQQYACKSEERSAHARKAAEERWAKQKEQTSNAQSMPDDARSINEHADSNAPESNNQCFKDTKVSSSTSADIDAPAEGETAPFSFCPQGKILALYREILPELPQPRNIRRNLAAQVRSRWVEKCKEKGFASEDEGLAYFRKFFTYVANNDFLTGRKNSGGRSWRCDYAWLMKAENFDKVTSGYYGGANA